MLLTLEEHTNRSVLLMRTNRAPTVSCRTSSHRVLIVLRCGHLTYTT